MKKTKEKGITLIALVVTIIILLILAGVTLVNVLGEKGIFEKTKKAVELYRDKSLEEQNDIRNLDRIFQGTYTIEYNANEGENAPEKTIKKSGENIKLSEKVPKKLKNAFCGWATSKENADKGEVKYYAGDEYTLNEDITLYAVWEEIKVGDYIKYTYDDAEDYKIESTYSGYTSDQEIKQDKDMKWKVLNINDDGTIEIISEDTTTQNVYFTRALGYNNIVYYLNDICAKQYSNKELNVEARSLNLKDIEENMNEEGIKTRNAYKIDNGFSSAIQYGQTRRFFSDQNCRYYPKLTEKENKIGINTTVVNTNGIEPEDPYYNTPTTETYAQCGNTRFYCNSHFL